jgi:hypothetical protein
MPKLGVRGPGRDDQRAHYRGRPHAGDDTRRRSLRRRLRWHVEILDTRRFIHRTDELHQVAAERVGIAPSPPGRDLPLGVDDELGVRCVAERVLELVGHRVGQPRDLGAQTTLGLLDVHQPLLECERGHVVVVLGVGQGLVEVVERDASGRVVSLDRLQPGDVSKEGRSGETTKNEHRVPSA